jgi:hypothetical protein
VNQHGDLTFSFKNENTELPINFAFDRLANFKVRPQPISQRSASVVTGICLTQRLHCSRSGRRRAR